MGLPVDARGAGAFCLGIDFVDEGAGDAASAGGFGGEEILKIADGRYGGGAAVIEVVGEAEELAAAFGDEGVDGFDGVDEAGPGSAGDFGR